MYNTIMQKYSNYLYFSDLTASIASFVDGNSNYDVTCIMSVNVHVTEKKHI